MDINEKNVKAFKERWGIEEDEKSIRVRAWLRKKMWNEITTDFLHRERMFLLSEDEFLIVTHPLKWEEPFDDTWDQIAPIYEDGFSYTKVFDRRDYPVGKGY